MLDKSIFKVLVGMLHIQRFFFAVNLSLTASFSSFFNDCLIICWESIQPRFPKLLQGTAVCPNPPDHPSAAFLI